MVYSIRQLASLSGVSTRTLRYYEEVGLLLPAYKNNSGCRFYGEREVDTLQQILFYKERDFTLKQIRELLIQSDIDTLPHLENHLADLQLKKKKIEAMIENLTLTIQVQKGQITMTTEEKFQAFKGQLIQKNEATYGAELGEKYGKEELNEAKQNLASLSKEGYQDWQRLEQQIKTLLRQAIAENWHVTDDNSKQLVQLHKEWLQVVDKHYSTEKHIGIAQLYVADERFTVYYDAEVKGCAAFLNASIQHWAGVID